MNPLVEPPLLALHVCIRLVELLGDDAEGVSLLSNVGGHEVLPVGLRRQDIIGLSAAESNHLAHALLLGGAIVRDVGRGVKGKHGGTSSEA